jgi:hypothetical protein
MKALFRVLVALPLIIGSATVSVTLTGCSDDGKKAINASKAKMTPEEVQQRDALMKSRADKKAAEEAEVLGGGDAAAPEGEAAPEGGEEAAAPEGQ